MGVPVVLEIHNCLQQTTKLPIEDADWAGMLPNGFSSLWTSSGPETSNFGFMWSFKSWCLATVQISPLKTRGNETIASASP